LPELADLSQQSGGRFNSPGRDATAADSGATGNYNSATPARDRSIPINRRATRIYIGAIAANSTAMNIYTFAMNI